MLIIKIYSLCLTYVKHSIVFTYRVYILWTVLYTFLQYHLHTYDGCTITYCVELYMIFVLFLKLQL